MNRIQKIALYSGWSLSILFLIAFISASVYFNNKVENVKMGVAVDTIENVLETTNHTYKIYGFAHLQYEQGLINSADLSKNISDIMSTYDQLIRITETKANVEKSESIYKQTINMLNLQKDAYTNLKSALDYKSDNFNKVAEQKFAEASALSNQIVTSLGSYFKTNTNDTENNEIQANEETAVQPTNQGLENNINSNNQQNSEIPSLGISNIGQ